MGLIEKYEKRKLRYEKQLSQMSDDSELSEYGFWDKGYLRGKIAICDDIIDDLNKILIGEVEWYGRICIKKSYEKIALTYSYL